MKHGYQVYKLTLGNNCSLLISVITLERIAKFRTGLEVQSKKFIKVAQKTSIKGKIQKNRINESESVRLQVEH